MRWPSRAAEAKRSDIAAEFALGFDRLARIGPAVTVFGSARTPETHTGYAVLEWLGERALADGRIDARALSSLHRITDPAEVVRNRQRRL